MAFKLDDIINEKKGPPPVLDLSKMKITSKDELEKALEKVPDYKIKPEKVRPEDISIGNKSFNFRSSKVERLPSIFSYPDPVPSSMKEVNLDDLSNVDIPWRMLTMARPKNRSEEDFFNRLVVLARARRVARKLDNVLPEPTPLPRAKQGRRGKGQVTELHFPSCRECCVELCQGGCKRHNYDTYIRVPLDEKEEDPGDGVTALIGGSADNLKGGRRKPAVSKRTPGVPRFRRKKTRRKKRRTTASAQDSDEEGGGGLSANPTGDRGVVTMCSGGASVRNTRGKTETEQSDVE